MKNKKDFNSNATKHGIFAQIVLKNNPFGEDREHFSKLLSMLRESIRPMGSLEEALVEKLAVQYYRLLRVYRADLKTAPKMFARVTENLAPARSVEAKWISPKDQVVIVRQSPSIDTLVRYETNLERQIGRTLAQIDVFQQMRPRNFTPALPSADLETSDDELERIS